MGCWSGMMHAMPTTVDDVIEADHEARRIATEHVAYIRRREST